ncbi:MAG: hypothetical protein ACREL7_06410 [Longimicrobiales bacterium]
MDAEIERAAARVLRDGSPSLSMRQLHARVVAEIGPAAGSYVRFADALRRRHDLFAVVEPEDPLADAAPWPPQLLAEYRRALAAAGHDSEPVVVLMVPMPAGLLMDEPEDSVIGQVGRSLADLLGPSRRDPALDRAIALSVVQTQTLARAVISAEP